MNTEQRRKFMDSLTERAVKESLSLRRIKELGKEQGLQIGEALFIYEEARKRNDRIRATAVNDLVKDIGGINEGNNKPN